MNKFQPTSSRQGDAELDDTLSRIRRVSSRRPDDDNDEVAIDLRAVAGVLFRHKWAIVATIFFGMALSALYLTEVERQYTATALVRSNDFQAAALGMADNTADIATEIEYIRSEAVLLRAAAALQLPASPVFESRPSRLQTLLNLVRSAGEPSGDAPPVDWQTLAESEQVAWANQLGRRIAVSQRRDANVIAISASTPVPQASADWANAVAQAYVTEQVTERQARYRSVIEVLEAQVAALQGNVEAADGALGEVYDTLDERAELLELADAEVDAQRQAIIRAQVQELEVVLRQRMFQNTTAADVTTPDPPPVLEDQLAEYNLPQDLVAGVFALQENSRIAQQDYTSRLGQLRQLEQDAGLILPDWTVISRALVPGSPSYPSVRSTLLLAFLASAAAGVGLAFFRENWRGGITSAEQLERVLGLPVITTIPRTNSRKVRDPSWAAVRSPLSAYAESIRRLRLGLEALSADNPLRLVVTSALPGEGKTTVALSVARALAGTGRRTVLIDADLRHPNVRSHTDVQTGTAGLIDYLVRGSDGSQLVVAQEAATDLALVLGGEPSPVATEALIASRRFQRVVDWAATEHDCVVFDTPPAGLVVDAAVLAHKYGTVALFVVKADSTTDRTALSALREFQKHIDVPVLAVLNQARSGRRNYGKYSSYYRSAED